MGGYREQRAAGNRRDGGAGAAVPPGLVIIAAVFLLVIAYLVAGSLTRRSLPTFGPSPIEARVVPPGAVVIDTITVDATDASAWRFFDFDQRSVVYPPDTVGWDLAIRRFRILASDGVSDLGQLDFGAADQVPGTGHARNVATGDTVNPAIERWYRYSFFSHLLEPKGHVYAVRTPDLRFAKLEILSYYCPGLQAGCLTFRYMYPVQPAGG